MHTGRVTAFSTADAGAQTLDVSVVIVNHNHREIIEHCFDSLFRIPDRAMFEAILIDNTCTDGTSEWVREHYPRVRIHHNEVRRGFAANANAGMRGLNGGRYVLLLNPDVVCFPGLLDRLVAFMDQNPRAGIAAPRLLNADGSLQHNCRRFPTPVALALRALRVDGIWPSARLRDYLMSDWNHAEAREVDWATGAVLLVRREAIDAVGLMDERYFLYWEDLDWCYRMRSSGWSVHYVPEACACHGYRREGVSRPFSRAGREQVLGALKFFRKFGWNPHKRPARKVA